MSGRLFVIGDTHFGHHKIILPHFEKAHRNFETIEEHDEVLVYRWNSVVRNRDTVYHLGDVLFGLHSFRHLARLNGTKKLVAGNHDVYPTARYLEHFNSVFGAVKVRDCILTHIPVHESQFYRYRFNVHGHLHSKQLEDRRYICASAEHNNLTPIELDRLLAERS